MLAHTFSVCRKWNWNKTRTLNWAESFDYVERYQFYHFLLWELLKQWVVPDVVHHPVMHVFHVCDCVDKSLQTHEWINPLHYLWNCHKLVYSLFCVKLLRQWGYVLYEITEAMRLYCVRLLRQGGYILCLCEVAEAVRLFY